METAVPLRAWRYAPAAGDPARLVAPPYDVIGPDLQSRLYAAHPHNVVRVDLGMTTPSDNDCENQYTRAAAQLDEWKRSGVLTRDPEPAVTFVEEDFVGPDGQARRRHGFLAVLRLYDFAEGVVFPHEETFSGPKEDRFRLMTATAMSLSPVFMLYELQGDGIIKAWQAGLASRAPAATVEHGQGSSTRLWPTSEPGLLREISTSLSEARFIIADGHHRYETALRYRDQARAKHAAETPSRPSYDYCLAYFANAADPALAIYPTHRLLNGLDERRLSDLPDTLSRWFDVQRLTDGGITAETAQAVTTAYLGEHDRKAFTLWSRDLPGVYGLQLIADTGASASAGSAVYRDLDVTILRSVVFEQALGMTQEDIVEERFVTFSRDPDEAFAKVATGEFQAGLFLNPPGLDQVRDVAFGGERMPHKATFFYPKLPTGLVFHDLSGSL